MSIEDMIKAMAHLNSNLILLIHAVLASYLLSSIKFKFQSDSINTILRSYSGIIYPYLNSNLILLIHAVLASYLLSSIKFKFQSDSINTRQNIRKKCICMIFKFQSDSINTLREKFGKKGGE